MTTVLTLFFTALVVAFTMWASLTAQRLNRLHIRVDSCLDNLQSALDRRAAIAAALESQLHAAAMKAESIDLKTKGFLPRMAAEKHLEQVISENFERLPSQLVEENTRVQLAQRFYNEAVADTRALRLRPLVKVMRLGGTARVPEFFDLGQRA